MTVRHISHAKKAYTQNDLTWDSIDMVSRTLTDSPRAAPGRVESDVYDCLVLRNVFFGKIVQNWKQRRLSDQQNG